MMEFISCSNIARTRPLKKQFFMHEGSKYYDGNSSARIMYKFSSIILTLR